jgi:hypothetical protein
VIQKYYGMKKKYKQNENLCSLSPEIYVGGAAPVAPTFSMGCI